MKRIYSVPAFVSLIICMSFINHVSYQAGLPSGWYVVTSTNGIELPLKNTDQAYTLENVPVITINHVKAMQVGMTPRVNGKSFPALTFTFDATGTAAINQSGAFSTYHTAKQNLGLVVNHQLILVTPIYAPVKGPQLTLSSSHYTLEQLNSLRSEIQAAIAANK